MENKRRWHSLSSVYIEHKFRQIESQHLLSDSVGLLKLMMMSKCKEEDLVQRTMTKRGPQGLEENTFGMESCNQKVVSKKTVSVENHN